MCSLVSLTLVFLLMRELHGKQIPTFAGPYISYAEYARPCDAGGRGLTFNMRASPFNPTKPFAKQLITGNVTFDAPLDDSVMIFLKVDVFRNNEWKPNAFIFKFPRACSSLREQAPSVFDLLNGGKPTPKSGSCKLEGVHKLNNHVEFKFPHFPVMPYGRYRLNMNVGTPDKQDASCGIIVGHIVPRP